jgi:hypothetical protein
MNITDKLAKAGMLATEATAAPAGILYQEQHGQVTAGGAPATGGILATEGTPATAEYQEHRTSNSSRNASNSRGGSKRGNASNSRVVIKAVGFLV